MDQKEIRELRKLYTKERCSVSRLCGCYVSAEKEKVATFAGSLLGMDDTELLKYMELLKKCLSGSIGRNLFNLDIPLKFEQEDDNYRLLSALREGRLQNGELMDLLYDRIIETFHYSGNYLILVAADTYDIPGRTALRDQLDDASEESYTYMLCAICPVELAKPGLRFNAEEGWFTAIDREWIAGKPEAGFLFPAFNDRSTDIHAALFYANSSEELPDDMISGLFGSEHPVTAEEKKNAFGTVISAVYGEDFTPESVKAVHETLAQEAEIIKNEPGMDSTLSRSHVRSILEKSGATDAQMERFDASFDAAFEDGADLDIDNIYSKNKFTVTSDSLVLRIDADRTDLVHFEEHQGARYAVIELEGSVEINGVPV